MKAQILAAALLLGTSGVAFAADAVVEQVVVVDTAYNWSGLYVGAQAGYGWTDGRVGQLFAPDSFDSYGWDYDADGGFGGVHFGYNYQFANNMVLGIEADYNWSGIDGTTVYEALNVPDPAFGGILEIESFGSIRARAGYALGRWMPFVTGGIAIASYEHSSTDLPGNIPYAVADGTLTGYTLGAGVDFAITNNWILKAEYRFADYGQEDSTRYSLFDGSPFNLDGIDVKSNDVRVGVSYKF